MKSGLGETVFEPRDPRPDQRTSSSVSGLGAEHRRSRSPAGHPPRLPGRPERDWLELTAQASLLDRAICRRDARARPRRRPNAGQRAKARTVHDGPSAWRRLVLAAVNPRTSETSGEPDEGDDQDGYGSADVLALDDIAMPVAGDDEVLIRVRRRRRSRRVASHDRPAVHRPPYGRRAAQAQEPDSRLGCCREHRGDRQRMWRGFSRGMRCSAPAAGLRRVRVRSGGHLAPKPVNLSFEQAAGVPVSGCTARRGLRDAGGIQAGQAVPCRIEAALGGLLW